MEIISRKEAIGKGLKYYFTGKPCKRGHIEKRRLSGCCIECEPIKYKKWRDNNHDKVIQYQKKWRENNPEKIHERIRKYKKDNFEKIKIQNREYNRKYYQENREKVNEQVKKYRKANRKKVNKWVQKYNDSSREIVRKRLQKYRNENHEKHLMWNYLAKYGLICTDKNKFIISTLRLYKLFTRQLISQPQAAKFYDRIEVKDESVIKEIFSIKLQ